MKDTDNIDHEIPWHEDPLGIGGGSSNVQKNAHCKSNRQLKT